MPDQEQGNCPPLELTVSDGAKTKESLGDGKKEETTEVPRDDRVS